jgi:CheY-like chemotaxis protein
VTCRVAVLDDNADFRYILGKLLGQRECSIVATYLDVSGATDTRAQWAETDVVVLDFWLPDGDGVQVAQWLKNHPDTSHVSVILYTALPMAREMVGDRMRYVDAVHMKGPGHLRTLVETIRALSGHVHA